MSASRLDETLANVGYAKVIVSLAKPTAAAISRSASEDTLQSRFIIPSEAQSASLATAALRFASRRTRGAAAPPQPRVRVYPHLGLALGFADQSGVAALRSDRQVQQVEEAPELSLIRPVAARPAKTPATVTWGIRHLKADQLWASGFTGKGIVVAHLDTGVDGSHPALKGAIKAFAEFDMAGEQVPDAKPTDSGEHGTHTAGTIVARPGQKGTFGVAPEAQLASAMVIEGGQVIDRILGGMDWAVEKGVRILSMSLGLRGFTPAFQTVIDALRNANVLPVIAVGNEFANSSRSPGNYANVLSVGATNAQDMVADFSSSQRFNRPDDALVPDIVAPGVDILSCVPGNGFAEMDGSSMATPHVAGLAALLLQARPNSTTDELEQAILKSCSRPATMPQARANRGVPDAVQAYTELTGTPLPPAVAVAAVRPVRRGRKKSKRETMPIAAGKTRKGGRRRGQAVRTPRASPKRAARKARSKRK
jgi:subtilisin